MKTTKRSKMLVSSIAMLLVALVALGSATYAWYSITRTVYANDATITASTPGGLYISKTASDTGTATVGWGDTVTLTAGTDIEPAALAFDSNGSITPTYYDGTDESNGSAISGAKTAVAGVDYYVQDEIYLKNTNSVNGAIKVTATASGAGLASSYSCIALVDDNGDVAYVAYSAGSTTVANAVASTTQSASAITTLNAAGANVQHYYVVTWVDGYNSNCINNNAATMGTIDWDLSFTMDDVA